MINRLSNLKSVAPSILSSGSVVISFQCSKIKKGLSEFNKYSSRAFNYLSIMKINTHLELQKIVLVSTFFLLAGEETGQYNYFS